MSKVEYINTRELNKPLSQLIKTINRHIVLPEKLDPDVIAYSNVERAELKTQIIETAEFWTTWENDGFNFKLEMEVRDPYTQIMRLTQTCVSDEVEEPEYDLINKLAVGRSSWHKDSLNTAQASLYTESYPLVVEMVKAYNLIRANLVSDL